MRYDIDWRDIPVYIVNRNRLDCGFRHLVAWLQRIGMRRIIILDNQSTYPPLLDYYKEMAGKIDICVQPRNLGPRGWWDTKEQGSIMTPYIYTDCDLVPANDCPDDVVGVLLEILRTQESARKVGVSLRIDNLPDHFSKKGLVIKWESGFWTEERRVLVPGIDGRAFDSNLDTTFCMYHPQQSFTYTALRLDKPYSFEHVPWYADESKPSPEDIYYKEHYETEHEGGTMWKQDKGGWALYGWSVRSKESLEETFRIRGLL